MKFQDTRSYFLSSVAFHQKKPRSSLAIQLEGTWWQSFQLQSYPDFLITISQNWEKPKDINFWGTWTFKSHFKHDWGLGAWTSLASLIFTGDLGLGSWQNDHCFMCSFIYGTEGVFSHNNKRCTLSHWFKKMSVGFKIKSVLCISA